MPVPCTQPGATPAPERCAPHRRDAGHTRMVRTALRRPGPPIPMRRETAGSRAADGSRRMRAGSAPLRRMVCDAYFVCGIHGLPPSDARCCCRLRHPL